MASDDEDASLAHFLESEVLSELSDTVYIFSHFFCIFYFKKELQSFLDFCYLFFFSS